MNIVKCNTMPKLEKFNKVYNLSTLFDTYTCDLCGNHFPALSECEVSAYFSLRKTHYMQSDIN